MKNELDPDYDPNFSSGTASEVCFVVEARDISQTPCVVADQIFDNRWKRVHFERGAVGVPPCNPFQLYTNRNGYLSYPAAQALRWWLHANAEATMHGMCLETRLVEVRIESSYKAVAIATHALIGGEARNNFQPE